MNQETLERVAESVPVATENKPLTVADLGLRKNAWPKADPVELGRFYGIHTLDQYGVPTARWEDTRLREITFPYPMRLAWDPAKTLWKSRAHEQVVPSLRRIFNAIWKFYGGNVVAIREARMDLYGGIYCFRRARGLSSLSMHAYGAAIDLDPEKNAMGVPWKAGKGMMPEIVVQIFEAEGWKWGGKWKSRPDPMHFEATS